MHGTDRADKALEKRLQETATIKARLFLKGLSLLDIDRIYKLPRGTAGNTLKKPNAAGEKAIADALGTKPHLLWRTRYRASGQRLTPQPRENYVPVPPMAQRQKNRAA